jgi:hypothetical protein
MIDRRAFLSTGARAGITLCGLCACSQFPTLAFAGEGLINPSELNYCGYSCTPDCKFRRGTIENNVELKKEAWKAWKIEERFGVVFDPEQAICHGCKSLDKPEGFVVQRCDVRSCAIDRGMDSCVQCEKLLACDKDLWRRFPKFKEQVVEMQKTFVAQV